MYAALYAIRCEARLLRAAVDVDDCSGYILCAASDVVGRDAQLWCAASDLVGCDAQLWSAAFEVDGSRGHILCAASEIVGCNAQLWCAAFDVVDRNHSGRICFDDLARHNGLKLTDDMRAKLLEMEAQDPDGFFEYHNRHHTTDGHGNLLHHEDEFAPEHHPLAEMKGDASSGKLVGVDTGT